MKRGRPTISLLAGFRRLVGQQKESHGEDFSDVEGSSFHAIARRRRQAGCELKAHLYRFGDSRFIVSSILWTPGSVILEVGDPSILPLNVSDDALGAAVCTHLLSHEARTPPDLRGRTRKDWAAYMKSGARSVQQFESESWRIAVETINQVLQLEAAPMVSPRPEIAVKGTSDATHARIGATIRRMLEAGDALRRAALI